jgi:hypothetical protein
VAGRRRAIVDVAPDMLKASVSLYDGKHLLDRWVGRTIVYEQGDEGR